MEENKKEYVYPEIKNYIKEKDLIDSYKKYNNYPFISLNSNNKTEFISLKTIPNILLYGISENNRKDFIRNVLFNIMLKTDPSECRFVIIHEYLDYVDLKPTPHSLELSNVRGDSLDTLRTVYEMVNARFYAINETGATNIEGYNEHAKKKNESILPYICVIIDKLDNILLSGNKDEIDGYIREIVRLGRAVGVFMIVSIGSLNPSIITKETISYFSTRISFMAHSKQESTLLLDKGGAENLKENELYINSAFNYLDGLYSLIDFDDNSFDELIQYVCTQPKPDYKLKKTINEYGVSRETNSDENHDTPDEYDDPLYNDIVAFVVEQRKASASLLQRRFKLGYNRANRVIDLLEERGIIGPATGYSKPREVLVKYGNDNELETKEIPEITENNNYQNDTNNAYMNNYKSYNGVQRQNSREKNEAIFKMILEIAMIGIVIYALVIAASH